MRFLQRYVYSGHRLLGTSHDPMVDIYRICCRQSQEQIGYNSNECRAWLDWPESDTELPIEKHAISGRMI